MASVDLRYELTCSICLTIYTDPVTLACGHSFCRVCIGDKLKAQDRSRSYTCPECQDRFANRPTPETNEILSSLVESFQHVHPEKVEVGIPCAYCIESPVPAAKRCLLCEADLCENHLRVHTKSEEHVLVELSTSLGNRTCSIHKKVLEYYCCEDAVCICLSCSLAGGHRGHQVETLNEASEKKKGKLRNILKKLTSTREKAETRVQSLQVFKGQVQEKAARVTKDVSALIKVIRDQLYYIEKRVLSEISRQEEKISDLIHQLETRKDELSRKMGHLEKLCHMTDPLTVLQEKESDSDELCNTEDIQRGNYTQGKLEVGMISRTLHSGLENIATTLKRQLDVLADKLLDTSRASGSFPDARDTSDISPYVNVAPDLLFDVATASNNVCISSDLKTASWSEINQSRQDKPERFQYYQVLSSRNVSSGKHYWEVEVSKAGNWRLGLVYPSMARKGNQSEIGNNAKSWCLERTDSKYVVRHKGTKTYVPHTPKSQRIMVYLHYDAGQLSFYECHDQITHLYTFIATFTEPVHIGCKIFMNSWVKIIW